MVEAICRTLNGRQVAIADAFLQRVRINGLAEVGVGVYVDVTLRRGGQAQLHRRLEVLEDAAPAALVARAAAMAFVDDDEVEEVRLVAFEGELRFFRLGITGHEGLEDREEHAGIARNAPRRIAQAESDKAHRARMR